MTRLRPRLVLHLLAAALAFAAALRPSETRVVPTVDVMLAVDITGSMNARDYGTDNAPESRLAHLRRLLPATVAALPCGSKVGLSIFTERRTFTLFDPVEVCDGYPVIAASIDALDWRMSWEGDSHVASGLHHAIAAVREGGHDLVFLTDGHQAPPLPWTGGPPFEGEPGAVRGLVVGVGGTTPVPIPKFDDRGREAGFYAMAEIPQESRLGAPPPEAEQRPGWHPRNNPYGDMPAGTEHLTELREAHLAALATEAGLAYARLGTASDLAAAITAVARPHPVVTIVDRAPLVGGLALAAATLAFLLRPLSAALAALKGRPLTAPSSLPVAALLLVALVLPAAAHGPTPQKVAEAIDIAAPCEIVWSKLRDFGSIGGWHPGLTAVEATGASERGATRTLTMPNGEQVVEKLDEVDGALQSIAWRLSRENLKALPVSFYTARMVTTRPDPGPSCRVEWEGRFYRGDTTNEPPPELSDEAAVAAMTDFIRTGLAGLKAALE